MTGNVCRFVCALTLALVLPSCGGGGGSTPTTPTTPAASTVTGVTVTGPTSSATVGQTAQFSATATLSNSTTQSVTSQASWQSSNGGVASVSGSGMVTALAAGDADLRATYSGSTGSAHITVVAPAPVPGPGPAPSSGFTLTGRVTEAGTNTSLADVRVEVKDHNNAATTSGTGNYTLSGISAGNYTLRGTKSGYDMAEPTVSISGTRTLDFTMRRVSTPSPTPSPTPTPSPSCCRVCTVGKACGNTCIERSDTCHVPTGCACNALTSEPELPLTYTRVPLPLLVLESKDR
jgi:hypothetical protein